jgi:hypothetical protein
MSAIIQTMPDNGQAFLGQNGALSYTPNPGFVGVDTFTYVARSTPGPQLFDVDPTRSSVDLIIAVNTPVGNDTQRADDLEIIGNMTGLPTPSTTPFSVFHLQNLLLTVNESAALNFCFSEFFGSCIAGVDAESSAGAITLTMNSAGDPAAVDNFGVFNQLNNLVDFSGEICVTPTGLASELFPAGPQALDQMALPLDITNSSIIQTGSMLTLTVPIDFEGSFIIDAKNNVTIDVELQGLVVATSPAQPLEDSSPATVSITVGVPDSDGDGMPDDWETANGLDPQFDDAGLDLDCDGKTNLEEYLAGTDPQDAGSFFCLTSVIPNGEGLTVTFPSITGRSYVPETSRDLVTWLPGLEFEATEINTEFLWNPGKGDLSPDFFRIRTIHPGP